MGEDLGLHCIAHVSGRIARETYGAYPAEDLYG